MAMPITVLKGEGLVMVTVEEMGVAMEKSLVGTAPVATVNCLATMG